MGVTASRVEEGPLFVGQHFWARGYYVSTVGQDERVVAYIQQQEREDRRSSFTPPFSLWAT